MAFRRLRAALASDPLDDADMRRRRAMARRAAWACLVPFAVLVPLAPVLLLLFFFPWGTVSVLWGATLLVGFMALFSVLPAMAFGAAWLGLRPERRSSWTTACVALVGALLLVAAVASLLWGESRPPPPDVKAGPAVPGMALLLAAQGGLLLWGAVPLLAHPRGHPRGAS